MELKAGAHRAHMRIAGEIAGAMSRMLGAETRWNQDLNLLPHQFSVRVPENLLALNVGKHNSTLLVDDKHRVRGASRVAPKFASTEISMNAFTRLRRLYTDLRR